MKLSAMLKAYAEKNLGVKAGSAAGVYFRAVAKAVEGGKMTSAQAKSLAAGTSPRGGKKGGGGPTLRDELKASFQDLAASIKEGMTKSEPTPAVAKDTRTPAQKAFDERWQSKMKESGLLGEDGTPVGPKALLAGAAPFLKSDSVRVKGAAESYAKERSAAHYPDKTGTGATHAMSGRPVKYDDRTLYHGSELDKAVSGAYLKMALSSTTHEKLIPRNLRVTDHDRDLFAYALHECAWTGILRGSGDFVGGSGIEDPGAMSVHNRKLSALEQKALLDDTASGGIEAAPIVFDDMVILTPVLYGELFPHVNVVNISRGRRIEGFSMGNPTFISGAAEGATITPFNTATFIQAFDTTIFVATAAMEIGLDLEEDSPADIGGIVSERFGLKYQELLDNYVAVGDGVTMPQGIFNAPGTTVVPSDNSGGGAPTVGDYEGLMFGVSKAFRNEPGATTCFVANDTSYQRARSIPVGPTDERRVFGMTHQDYRLLGHPYKVQNSIANNQIAFVNLKRYRMYRRLGLQTAITDEGQYLKTRNMKLLIMRARMGGQLELGGAMSQITDGQL